MESASGDAAQLPRTAGGRGHLVRGSMWVLLAQALFPISGVITAAVLSRWLGPDRYGLLTVSVSIVLWGEVLARSLLLRSTVKVIADADDWQPIATRLLQVQLIFGAACGGLILLLASPIAEAVGEPGLAGFLRLLALNVPLATMATGYRSILTGLGRFRIAALGMAIWALARLGLIVLWVALGFGIEGAIAGIVGGSLVELATLRLLLPVPILARSAFRIRAIAGSVAPLFGYVLCMQLFQNTDLVLLGALGGSAQETGFFAAASNVALVPTFLASVLAPLLLATISRLLAQGNAVAARAVARDALRGVLLLMPLATLGAAAAPGIVELLYGPRYAPSAPLLSILLIGSMATFVIAVATSVLAAAGRAGDGLAVAILTFVVGVGSQVLLIPAHGSLGAAWGTAAGTGLGASVAIGLLYRHWAISPPPLTALRCGIVACAAGAAALAWPVRAAWLPVQLLALSAAIGVAYVLLAEFSRRELASIRRLLVASFPAHGRTGQVRARESR